MDKIKSSATYAIMISILAAGGFWVSGFEPEGTDPELVVPAGECYFIYEGVCFKTKEEVKEEIVKIKDEIKETKKADEFVALCEKDKDAECVKKFKDLVKEGIKALKTNKDPVPMDYNESQVMIKLSEVVTIKDLVGEDDILKAWLEAQEKAE